MEAIKFTQTSNNNKLTINIPDAFISKKLEIIVFPFDDEADEWVEHNINTLNKAYSSNEPEYDLTLVKEPNIEYGKR